MNEQEITSVLEWAKANRHKVNGDMFTNKHLPLYLGAVQFLPQRLHETFVAATTVNHSHSYDTFFNPLETYAGRLTYTILSHWQSMPQFILPHAYSCVMAYSAYGVNNNLWAVPLWYIELAMEPRFAVRRIEEKPDSPAITPLLEYEYDYKSNDSEYRFNAVYDLPNLYDSISLGLGSYYDYEMGKYYD